MTRVTVRNTLREGQNIIVKEGNAGVYRLLATVEPDNKFVITLDPNATYREYVLITLPDNNELPIFSSDDLQGCKSIVVKETDGNYYWEKDPVETTQTDRPLKRSFWQSVKGLFRFR